MPPPVVLNASEHPIKTVTIFSSRKAEIVRKFSVQLENGQNEFVVRSLPNCVDFDSARVTGLGDAVLFDVTCSLADDDEGATPLDDSEQAAARRKLDVLQSERRVHERKADILMLYGRSLNGENATPGTVSQFLDKFVESGKELGKIIAELDSEIAEALKDVARLKRLSEKRQQRAQTKAKITAVIMAKRAGQVTVTLTYIVNNVSWSPTYDLRAATDGGRPPRSVVLQYRASITQITGEDWKDTSVVLSTATPGQSAQIPRDRGLRIVPSDYHRPFGAPVGQRPVTPLGVQNPVNHFSNTFQYQAQQPQQPSMFGAANNRTSTSSRSLFGAAPPMQAQAAGGLFGQHVVHGQAAPGGLGTQPAGQASTMAAFGTVQAQPLPNEDDTWSTIVAVGGAEAAEEDLPGTTNSMVQTTEETPGPWSESGTVVTESAVSSAFRIEGSCSIPSDKTAHKVAVAVLTFDAHVQYVVVPRAKAAAFLQCEVTNTSEYRLLPGPVHVYLDNMHVSKTTISDVNPEETFKCTLGSDPALRVVYSRLPRKVTTTTSAFAAQTSCATYRVITTLQNTHTFSVKDVVLRDVIPVAPEGQAQGGVAIGVTNALQAIKVVLKEPKGLSEAKPLKLVEGKNLGAKGGSSSVKVRWTGLTGDKDGRYEWVVTVGAGEEVKVETVVEVHAPSHYSWQLHEENA